MPRAISAFGYSVQVTEVLIFIALIVGLALAVQFWLTIAWSTFQSVKQTRRQHGHDELRNELLDRTFDPDTDWDDWATGLSSIERDVVKSLLEEYLRELDGQNKRTLQELGDKLDIPAQSKQQLDHRNEFTRLTALTWLTLLERPELVTDFQPETPRERAVVARLRYENGAIEDPEDAMTILLDGTSSQFTIFGQDTLYRIATIDPDLLLKRGQNDYQTWSRPLLIQVLTVCQHLGTSITTEDLSWLTAILEHEKETIRAATVRALGAFGWRKDIRDDRFLFRLTRDPSPQVRGAVYETLSQWGDKPALDTLIATLKTEENKRACLTGTNALVEHRDQLDEEALEELGEMWDWSQTHAEYDTAARQRVDRVGK